MEQLQEIEMIITNYKVHSSKKAYKSFIKAVDNLKQNMSYKKDSDEVLNSFYLILLSTIENVKNKIRDIDYMNYLKSLDLIINFFKQNDEYYSDYEEYNYEDNHDYYHYNYDEENIINFDSYTDRVEYNQLILENFIKENNLSNDFLNSSFNVAEIAAYNYVHNNCPCDDDSDDMCNKFMLCKNIQKNILNNPLTYMFMYTYYIGEDMFMYTFNIDNICEDINKYKLFSFDGTINSLFQYCNYEQPSQSAEINIKILIELFELSETTQLRVLNLINMFNYIFTKEYLILNNSKFRYILYDKIKDLKDNMEHVEYWIDKLHLDSNIIDKIDNSIRKYFSDDEYY